MKNLTQRTIDGRTNRYADWRVKVVALVAARNIPDEQLELVTEPMLIEAWRTHETPEHFVAKIPDLW